MYIKTSDNFTSFQTQRWILNGLKKFNILWSNIYLTHIQWGMGSHMKHQQVYLSTYLEWINERGRYFGKVSMWNRGRSYRIQLYMINVIESVKILSSFQLLSLYNDAFSLPRMPSYLNTRMCILPRDFWIYWVLNLFINSKDNYNTF